jgi:hypothetical protein
MIAKIEAIQAWLESVTYQMCNMVSKHPSSRVPCSHLPVSRWALAPHHPDISVQSVLET